MKIESVFPRLRCISQQIDTPVINNIKATIPKLLDEYELYSYINVNDKVALTASSRGINNQALILKEIVRYLKEIHAHPFIIPAMGSHGGAKVRI